MRHSEKSAETDLAKKAAKDPDARLFLRRRRERLKDCLAAIERRIAHIKKKRA